MQCFTDKIKSKSKRNESSMQPELEDGFDGPQRNTSPVFSPPKNEYSDPFVTASLIHRAGDGHGALLGPELEGESAGA